MTILNDLLATYALIQDEARWCTEVPAIDASGLRVPAEHPDACQWCIEGAITKITLDDEDMAWWVERAASDLFDEIPTVINDYYGHRAATMVLRHAILREEGVA